MKKRMYARRMAWRGTLLLTVLCVSYAWAPGTRVYSQTPNVTVNATTLGATVFSQAIGINSAVWDGHLQDAGISGLIKQTGAGVIRFPGGSTADRYHWQTNSITPGITDYADPNNTFDNVQTNVIAASNAHALITANYGSNANGNGGGDPNEAAGWVNYANNVKHDGVLYWEIGQEVWGNGYYGSQWEPDLHSMATGNARTGDANLSPQTYGANVVSFANAMKAQDPTIKVGVGLVVPGVWPEGQGPQDWDNTVLSTACSSIDFITFHYYPQEPGTETDAGLLNTVTSIPTAVTTMRNLLKQYCGAHAAAVQILVTESNSVTYSPGKQTTSPINGLYLVLDYMMWLRAGARNVTWWDLHNGKVTNGNNSASLAGNTTYGDYGILSNGDAGEPALDAPFPAFIGLRLVHRAVGPSARFVAASTTLTSVRAFAVKRTSTTLTLTLVNKSPSVSYTVNPAISGMGTLTGANVWRFSLAAPNLGVATIPVTNGAVSLTLAPYSAAVLTLTFTGAAAR